MKELNHFQFGTEHINAFETDNCLLLSEELRRNIESPARLLEFQFYEDMWCEPYFPFLNIIRDSLSGWHNDDITSLFRENVYPAHRGLFSLFLKGESLFRNEEILMEELEYERSRMEWEIVGLLKAISEKTPLFFHLMNFEYASQSVLDIIKIIISAGKKSDIFLLCSFRERAHFLRVKEYSLVKSFFRDVNSEITKISFGTAAEENPVERPLDFSGKLKLLNSYFYFIDLEECELKAQRLYKLFIEHNLKLNKDDQFSLLRISGDIQLLKQNFDRALILYFSLLDFSQKADDLIFLTESYKRISVAHLLKNDFEEAVKYGILCDKGATLTGIELFKAQSAFLLFQLQRMKAAYAKSYINLCFDEYQDLFKLLERAGMFNTLAYVYTNGSLIISIVKSGSEAGTSLFYLKKGIELSEKIGNYFRISEAYNSQGIYYQATGDRVSALKFYNKSLKLKKKINNSQEISNINNGLGYFYFTEGDYKSASSHYNRSLKHLVDSKNYKEICGTLFNFASLNFFTFNYKEAIMYYKYMLLIMNPLEIVDLPYHSRVTIYSLLAICYLKSDNINLSLEFFSQIKSLPDFIEIDHDFEYFALLEALLEKDKGNFDHSAKLFERALQIQIGKNVEVNYFLIRVYHEYGCLFYEADKRSDAIRQWEMALNLCSDGQYPFMRTLLEGLIRGIPGVINTGPYKARNFNIKALLELVDLDRNINELHKRVGEISFLNNLQDTLRNSEWENNRGIIYNSLNLINNSFLIDTLIFAVGEDKKWSVADYITSARDLDLTDPGRFITGVLQSEENTYPAPFKSLAYIPVQSSLRRDYMLVCGNIGSDKPIDNDDLKVLTIAAKQMVTAVEKSNQELQILQENIDLEQKVKERTIELENSLKMIKLQREEIQEHNNQLEEIVKQRTEELLESEKLASLGGLVANLAHEINTPLGNIITTNSFVKDRLITFKDLFGSGQLKRSDLLGYLDANKESTVIIEANSKRIGELIDSFKQLSIDQAVLDKIPFQVRKYIDHIILVMKPTLDMYHHQLIIDCDPHLTVNSYPGLFSQVLTNLLLNSIIHAYPDDHYGIIKIEASLSDGKLYLLYSDDGIGMDKNTRKNVFQPFFTTKRNQGGTGLGMHIVFNIVTQNLNGSIVCESVENKGTSFTIELPV